MVNHPRSDARMFKLAVFTYARAQKAWKAEHYHAYDFWFDAYLLTQGINPTDVQSIR